MLVLITEIKEKTKEKKEKNILIEKAESSGRRIFLNNIFTRFARIDLGLSNSRLELVVNYFLS